MKSNDPGTTLKRLYNRINGSKTEYNLKPYYEKLIGVKKHGEKFNIQTDEYLKDTAKKLCDLATSGQSLDHLLPESYALVMVAIKRVLNLNPFDTQVIGGTVMHQGKIAEMPTGEGKTLTAVFPAFLNALTGKGVHILTFNDYLARRDAQWMGPVYDILGIKTGYVQEGMSIHDRKLAYAADVTYLTAREAGFDFLKDSLAYNRKDCVHRNFNYAIIDEADSILIDEARIPLVIASASDPYVKDSFRMAEIVRKLYKDRDLEFDEYSRNIFFTDSGLKHVENLLDCDNLYAYENINLLTQLNCALHAEYLFTKDVDYIVRNNRIELVDEFTGRVADKRRWPDGLQAALEAKENISIQTRGDILNSITLQHFIRKYSRICGMTATASSAEDEFNQFYGLDIVVIPPNKKCIREDYPDRLFKSKKTKNRSIINEIIDVHKTGRPILVGTASVEESEMLSEQLIRNGIDCEVLNAKNDEYEAGIISQAGKLHAITISTNMAGRGTDIRLGGIDQKERKQAVELGGLYVIGTNRHESRRIDNQLRGRSGRQGDPGSSRFFISIKDNIFIKYHLNDLLPTNIPEDIQNDEIENSIIKREAERVQRIVEGQNLEIKKTLFKYSSLIEDQRVILCRNRENTLSNDSAIELYETNCPENFSRLYKNFGREKIIEICRSISLHFIDKAWFQYLAEIADIREGIHLTRLGYKDPLSEFYKLAIGTFDRLLPDLESCMIDTFNSIDTSSTDIDLEGMGLKAPSSTWTYLINDDPFENMLATNFAASMGLSTYASFVWLWPFLVIYHLVNWLNKKKNKLY